MKGAVPSLPLLCLYGMRRKMFKVERMMRSVRKEEDEKCEEGGR
jgi:hypothetical protein